MASAFPGSERCVLCNHLLTDAADHTALGRLTDDLANPLHIHNHAHFHRTCLAVWPGLSKLIEQLESDPMPQDDKTQQAVMDLVTLRASAA